VAAKEAEVPVAMRKVYRRLERWRGKRQGRARIPESLWAAAGELAREHGVKRVSRVLRLEFNHLRRVAESGRGEMRRQRVTPAFVELIAPQTGAAPTCIIELQGQRGTMRIEWKGTAAALTGLSRTLWEMIS
jgi:hypothetical protein